MNKTTESILIAFKRELKVKGITYQDVADKLGYTRYGVSAMLNGHSNITLTQLQNILELIGGSLSVNLDNGAKYKLERFKSGVNFKKVNN